jgi:hypothetical protein
MIVQKYGTPGGSAFAHAALLSDVPTDDVDVMPVVSNTAYVIVAYSYCKLF